MWIALPSLGCLHATAHTVAALGAALNTSVSEIPKRGVNSAGPFEVCNTRLQ